MRLTLHSFLTLDGVMQAPGGPEEDTEGRFEFGGWSFPYRCEEGGAAIAGWFAKASAFLLGRKTYEIFASSWPQVTEPDHPIASKLNELPKFVASTTLDTLEWNNASLLGRDVAAEVATLKEQPGDELQVHGSGVLAHTLIDHELVDEYRLMYFPVHLGTGKKLFADGVRPGALELVDSFVTTTGVVFATYRRAGTVRQGSFEAA